MLCNMCPRRCNIDRSKKTGVCGVGERVKIAKAYLHMWEEPCISCGSGSGTVFFSGCNLKCVYCQNYEISSENKGKEISIEELVEIFKRLENEGASNINLVTPSHYIRAIKQALDLYRPNIPIVYNSSGYDSVEALEILKDYIDIYLLDFKYYDSELAERLSRAKDYPDVVKSVLLRAREYQPVNIYKNDKMLKGVIIRHMVLPNHTDDSISVLKWIKDNIYEPCVSLMGQYTPMYKANEHKDISRKIKPIEYKVVVKALEDLGITDGYIQDLSSAEESYVPVWDME